MMPSESSKFVTLLSAICALFLFIMVAEAQTDNLNIGINETTGNSQQPVSDSSANYGIAYSSVLRDMSLTSPEPVQPIRGGISDTSTIGPNGGLRLFGDFSQFDHISLPFTYGTISRKQLHLGRFDFHVISLSASMLASDNIYGREDNAQTGAIAIVRARVGVQAQLTDRLVFNTELHLFYLPFINRGGIAGFTGKSPIGDLAFNSLGGSELVYNGELAKWDLAVYNVFSINAIRAGANLQYSVDYGFSSPRESDQAGRYVFADGTDIPPSGNSHFSYENGGNAFLALHNSTGLILSRVVPTETKLEFGAEHTISWYDGDHGLVPHSADLIYASAESVRDNLRFKPKLEYSMSRANFNPDWSRRIQGLIDGPLTENTELHGGAGYFWRDADKVSTMTYHGGINHIIGPLTSEGFSFGQTVTEPVEEKLAYYKYHLLQVLGPELTAHFIASYFKFSSFENGVSSSNEEHLGAYLSYITSPLTRYRFSVDYTKVQSENTARDEYVAWRGRIDFFHRPFQTITLNASFIHTKFESSRVGGSYDEDLLVLTVTKSF